MTKSKITTLAKVAAVIALASFVGTNSSASAGTDLENLNWVQRGPVKIVMLWGDSKGESAFFLKINPGFKGSRHAHSEDYHGVTLQGVWLKTWSDNRVEKLPVGSHILQPKKDWHIDNCAGPEDCIFFIHFEGPRDIFFPKE